MTRFRIWGDPPAEPVLPVNCIFRCTRQLTGSCRAFTLLHVCLLLPAVMNVYLNDGDKQADYTIHVRSTFESVSTAYFVGHSSDVLSAIWAKQTPQFGSVQALMQSLRLLRHQQQPVSTVILSDVRTQRCARTRPPRRKATRASAARSTSNPGDVPYRNFDALLLPLLLPLLLHGLCLLPPHAGQDQEVYHQGLLQEQRSRGNTEEGSYRIPAMRVSHTAQVLRP